MSDKYDIAKKIFDENIAKIELPIGLSKTLDQDYVCKPLDQILADKYALCTEQIELAEHIFTQYDIKVNIKDSTGKVVTKTFIIDVTE